MRRLPCDTIFWRVTGPKSDWLTRSAAVYPVLGNAGAQSARAGPPSSGRAEFAAGAQNPPHALVQLLVDLDRRGTAPIFLPRRIYQRYQVVWNQIGWMAGENFIEITPKTAMPLMPLLAVLNASTTEVAVRANAHVYGGGVYNLSPGRMGDVPVVDIRSCLPQPCNGSRRRIASSYLPRGKIAPAGCCYTRVPWLTTQVSDYLPRRWQHAGAVGRGARANVG